MLGVAYYFIAFLCYDDGCHIKKFAENPIRSTATETAKRIAGLHIVVNKFHFSGHVDSWCQQNCNPYSYKELDNVSYVSYNFLF